ncbi:hypothetical protein BH23PSE1_BH23PSE1_12580 [soil metagenome]
MIQAVLLFLVLIVVLGMGRRFLPLPPPGRSDKRIEPAARCKRCKAYVVGAAPAPCERSDCPYR